MKEKILILLDVKSEITFGYSPKESKLIYEKLLTLIYTSRNDKIQMICEIWESWDYIAPSDRLNKKFLLTLINEELFTEMNDIE
jgi:hypothetical protein